jgi:MFS family permease
MVPAGLAGFLGALLAGHLVPRWGAHRLLASSSIVFAALSALLGVMGAIKVVGLGCFVALTALSGARWTGVHSLMLANVPQEGRGGYLALMQNSWEMGRALSGLLLTALIFLGELAHGSVGVLVFGVVALLNVPVWVCLRRSGDTRSTGASSARA